MSSRDFLIRETQPDDNFEEISAIYALAWKSAYRGVVPDEYLDELPLGRWAPLLEHSAWTSLVLLDGERYVGTGSVCPARDSAMPGWGEVISIYLLPEYSGRGCGGLLFEALLGALRGQGYEQVYLWVLAENARARAFYERHGFVNSGDELWVDIGGKRLQELRYVLDAQRGI